MLIQPSTTLESLRIIPLSLADPQPIFFSHANTNLPSFVIVEVFKQCWAVHALGIVNTFFGLNYVISEDCVSI